MNPAEDRLRDAMTAMAQTVQPPDIPPFELHATAPARRSPGRRLIPVAAAAAVLVAIGLVTALQRPGGPPGLLAAGTGQLHAQQPRPGAWTISASLPAHTHVTATVATGPATGWVFGYQPGSPLEQPAYGLGFPHGQPVAWQLSGGTWRPARGPALRAGEAVTGGSASGPGDVWVFTSDGRMLRGDGRSWHAVPGVPQHADTYSITVLSPADVWAFGQGQDDPATTAWHWDGRSWTVIPSGAGVAGASALSPTDIWAVAGVGPEVAHWNGARWIRTSLAGLLPPVGARVCNTVADTIVAQSDTDVWVVADRYCQAGNMQVSLMHETGGNWHLVATVPALDVSSSVLPDGQGGILVFLYRGQQPTPAFSAVTVIRCSAAGKLSTPPLPAAWRGTAPATTPGAPGSTPIAMNVLSGPRRHSSIATVLLRFGG